MRLVCDPYEAAERLAKRGNTIMHKGIYVDQVLPQLSRDSISDFVTVSIELDGKR